MSAADEPPLIDIPAFTPRPVSPGSSLPPLDIPADSQAAALAAGLAVAVRGVEISGNSAIPTSQLVDMAASYIGGQRTLTDLYRLRDALSATYVNAGYISSGATLLEPPIAEGVVRIRIVEGRLDHIQVSTDGRFRPEYFKQRLRATGPVVNLRKLEARLQLFEQDPRIVSVASRLLPGEHRGLANLELEVREASPYYAAISLANDNSPSIGAEALQFSAGHLNPSGVGDQLDASLRLTEGSQGLTLDYSRPLHADERSYALYLRGSRSEVIDENFAVLDIESRSATLGAAYHWPLRRTLAERLELSLATELRRSESFLLGAGFSFSEGAEDGVSKVAVLRLSLDWSRRGSHDVLSASSRFSLGLDAFGATENHGATPDGQFVSWLGRLQWARRLSQPDSTLIASADVQLSDSSLLGMERFAVGGAATVRGYRENTLVRDQGARVSLEWRLQLYRAAGSAAQIVPFLDAAYASNRGTTPGPRYLASAGLAYDWRFGEHWRAQLAVARSLRPIQAGREEDLQDDGVHFSLQARWP